MIGSIHNPQSCKKVRNRKRPPSASSDTSVAGSNVACPDSMTLRQASAVIPGRPHVGTILRWITDGVYPSGDKSRRVRLSGKKIGGRWSVSRQAIAEFIDAATGPKAAGSHGKISGKKNHTRARRRRFGTSSRCSHDRAMEYLRRIGAA